MCVQQTSCKTFLLCISESHIHVYTRMLAQPKHHQKRQTLFCWHLWHAACLGREVTVYCLQVEPFASLVTLSRYSVPRLLFNLETVGPFRSSRCRHTDVTVRGDVVESVKVLVQGAGWGVELEEIQITVSKNMRLHAAGACMTRI